MVRELEFPNPLVREIQFPHEQESFSTIPYGSLRWKLTMFQFMVNQVELIIVKEEKIVKKNTRKARNPRNTHLIFCIPLFFFTLRKGVQKIENLQTKKYPGPDFNGVGANSFSSLILLPYLTARWWSVDE